MTGARPRGVAPSLGLAGIVLAFALLVLWGQSRFAETTRRVTHTHRVIEAAERTLSTLRDAETGQRGFLLTGQAQYLEPYDAALGRLDRERALLRRLTPDNPLQQARLDTLDALVATKLRELAETVRLRRFGAEGEALALVRTDRGKRTMDAVRGVIGRIIATEERLLARREGAERSHRRRVLWLLLGGGVLAGAAAFLIGNSLSSYAREQAALADQLAVRNRALQTQNEDLQVATEELEMQGEELESQAEQLELKAVEMEEANETLVRINEELEIARQEAEAANAAKSQFLATMSHELRTPLNAIGGYVELVEMGIHGPVTPAQAAALERVRINQKHLLSLIQDILNFAKLEAGRLEFDLRPVPVAEVVGALEALMQPQIRAKGLQYSFDACPGGVHAVADEERMLQILLNVLGNAVKFTDEGGAVELSCERRGAQVQIHVRDTGRGIPPERLEQVFDPFVQVDRHRTEGSQQGVGLGLAIGRDLARAMGGDLTAVSVPGEGSTFTLSLPAA